MNFLFYTLIRSTLVRFNSNRIAVCLLYGVFFSFTLFADNPEWLAFVGMERVYDLISDGEYLWVGTDGGLVRMHKKTGKKDYFNTTNANLPGNRTWSLAHDSLGNLWIGGNWGVGYYDGTQWKVFTPSNSTVPAMSACVIAVDRKNCIWIGSAGRARLVKYDWSRWSVYKIFPYETGDVLAIVPDWQGKTMVGAAAGPASGLYQAAADTATGHLDSLVGRKHVFALAVDKNNNLLISADACLYSYTGDSLTVIEAPDSTIPLDWICDMKYGPKGEFYYATSKGLVKHDQGKWEVFNTSNSDIPSDQLLKMEIDEEGDVWVATLEDGVGKFDGSTWTNYTLSNSAIELNGINFHAIALDNAGNCWIAQRTTNLIKFDGNKWYTYDTSHVSLLDSVFKRIYTEKDKKIWADTSCAVVYSDSLGWHSYTIGRAGHGSMIKRDAAGVYWHCTPNGLYAYSDTGAVVYTTNNSNIPDNYCEKAAFDTSGVLWISIMPRGSDKQGMLVTFTNDSFTVQHTCRPTYWVSDIEIEPSNTMWYSVMTRSSVGIHSGEGIYKREATTVTNYSVENSGLKSNSVVDLCLDSSGILWIGSYYAGLTAFDRNSKWQYYVPSNSCIPSNEVVQVEVDDNDNKWINLYIDGLAIYRKGGIIFNNNTPIDAHDPDIHILPHGSDLKIVKSQLHFTLPEPATVTVTLYNSFGQRIGAVTKKQYPKGVHVMPVITEHNTIAQGFYFLTFKTKYCEKILKFYYLN